MGSDRNSEAMDHKAASNHDNNRYFYLAHKRNRSMALLLTQENFEKDIIQANKPAVIDVFATWCGPCIQMDQTFAELEQELSSQYIFAKLDVDEAHELSIQYGVMSVPTFLFIKDGAVVARETGYMSKAALLKAIQNAFA